MRRRINFMAIILLGISFILTACSKSVDTETLFTVETSGFNGYGDARVYLDRNKARTIFESYVGKLGQGNAKVEKKYNDFFQLLDGADFNLSAKENLKNGDSIDIELKADDNLKKSLKSALGANLGNTKFKHKVENLKEPQAFDIFDGVIVTFSGFNGMGNAEVKTIKNHFNLNFILDKTNNLSNGDVVKVISDADT